MVWLRGSWLPGFLMLSGAVALSAVALPGQISTETGAADANGKLVFKANARTVLLDVVVTGHDRRPVAGLHREDFLVTEDGRPQTIASFEEHTGPHSLQTNLPDLPPNVFSNVPRVTATDSVTVLLLDSLNTQIEDQSQVRAQILKYLRGMDPGRRVAIFTLGSRLRFIQGFTADPGLLVAALNDPKNGSGPKASRLLASNTDLSAEGQSTARLADGNRSAATETALNALRDFQGKQRAQQMNQRIEITLDALQQLGRYLADIPGRKNVVWFSGGFPLNFSPDTDLNDSFGLGREYDEDVRKTSDLLTGAEVAIYPVDASGLWAPNGGVSGSRPGGSAMLNQSLARNATHSAMDDIARDTGGEAIYNTNGLSDALARVVEHGSHFYTLAYTPTNTVADGRYRKLRVKLSAGGYTLAYRRGYFAVDPNALNALKAAGDPLRRYMGPGMPDSTQIPIALRVLPAPVATGAHPAAVTIAGDNDKLKTLKVPLTRYTVDFVVAARGLKLDPAPDGGRMGGIDVTLVVFDQDGAALNWSAKQVDLTMNAARYTQVQANGVSLHLEIDVPPTGVSLRGGIFDLRSGFAGTLEIPLRGVVAVDQAAGAKSK